MTVAETLKAAREFYPRRKKKWGQGALYEEGAYCVLGALCAVVTNEERIQKREYSQPLPNFKNHRLIAGAADALIESLELYDEGSRWATVYEWNDETTRESVIAGLRRAEKWARERDL